MALCQHRGRLAQIGPDLHRQSQGVSGQAMDVHPLDLHLLG